MSELRKIEISKVIANKNHGSEEELKNLQSSLEKNGMIEPILVKNVDGMYEVISGEKRFKAAKALNWEEIDAIVIDCDDDALAEVTVMGNSKKSMNAIEEAREYKKLVKQGYTQAEIASKCGLKQSTIANKMRLLKLPEYVQDAVIDGSITERHARALLRVSEEEMEEVFKVITSRGYNVQETENYLKALRERRTKRTRGVASNVRIGINTIKESYELCCRSGFDATMQVTEYENETKVVIRFKK